MLASGQRAGFFIGDGAGVGKGRQVRYRQISNPTRNWKTIESVINFNKNLKV